MSFGLIGRLSILNIVTMLNGMQYNALQQGS